MLIAKRENNDTIRAITYVSVETNELHRSIVYVTVLMWEVSIKTHFCCGMLLHFFSLI